MRALSNLQIGILIATFVALASFAATTAGAEDTSVPIQTAENTETAILAGGCFWCVESDFDKLEGVLETVSGYTGGNSLNPTYETHKAERHIEAVRISYDADKLSYTEILDYYFRHIDPTDAGGQFCDRGHSYTTAVFALTDEQEADARSTIEAIDTSGVLDAPIVTAVREAEAFYPAEDYHQDYYLKAPLQYNFYRQACRRDARVRAVWSGEGDVGG
ncbi:MAG: peptide-methionine (S)-S-oxide reductase MsrA [Pseudomonadota bacterium]